MSPCNYKLTLELTTLNHYEMQSLLGLIPLCFHLQVSIFFLVKMSFVVPTAHICVAYIYISQYMPLCLVYILICM